MDQPIGAPFLEAEFKLDHDLSGGALAFVQDLLGLAGGENAFAELEERYPVVTAEEIAAANPDAIFLCSEPFPFQDKHIEELVQLTGLPRERFHLADGEYLSWHGSRTPDGIDYAAGLIEAART